MLSVQLNYLHNPSGFSGFAGQFLFRLLIMVIICFVTNTTLFSQVKKAPSKQVQSIPSSIQPNPVNELIPGSLCGAEMYYKSITETEIEIFLTKYFYCTDFKIDTSETVTVQECIINMLTAKPTLRLVSVKDSAILQNLNCPGYKNGCIKQVVYSGRVNIMSPMMGGYDITWGYCCWDESHVINIQGIEEFQKQGLSLTLHIPEISVGEKNSSPIFLLPPVISTCKGQLIAINSSATDADSDSLGYELSALNNYKTENGIAYQDEPQVNPGQPVNKSFAGGRPPFKKVLYKKGFSAAKPLVGRQLEIHPKTGEIQLKADSIGEYLVGVSVKEYRQRKLLGTYQRVYKIHVVD